MADRFAEMMQWFKQFFQLVRGWWEKMAGWLSIPFMLLSLLNHRLLFAVLAYACLWALVISQERQISELKSHTKKADIAVYDRFDELVKQGEAMLGEFKKNEPPLPTANEFEQWDKRLIALAESCATIAERNRLLGRNVSEIAGDETLQIYTSVSREHWPIAEKLFSKLKISREIMGRLREESIKS
jgi:hypothetical protein